MVAPITMLTTVDRGTESLGVKIRKNRDRILFRDALLVCTTVFTLTGFLSRREHAARNEIITDIAIGPQNSVDHPALRHEGKALRINGDLEFKTFHPVKDLSNQETVKGKIPESGQSALYEFTLTYDGKVIRLFIPSGLTAHSTVGGIELSERSELSVGLNCLDSAKNGAFNRRCWVDGTVQMTGYGLGLFANSVFITN